jgi:hypothetical protein
VGAVGQERSRNDAEQVRRGVSRETCGQRKSKFRRDASITLCLEIPILSVPGVYVAIGGLCLREQTSTDRARPLKQEVYPGFPVKKHKSSD